MGTLRKGKETDKTPSNSFLAWSMSSSSFSLTCTSFSGVMTAPVSVSGVPGREMEAVAASQAWTALWRTVFSAWRRLWML